MSNILKAVIDVSAPGAVGVFNGIAEGSKKTEATLRQLTPAVSKLGSTLNALKFAVLDRKEELIRTTDIGRAKQLNVEIRNLEREIKRLQATGTAGFGAIGTAATKGLSGLRTLAYILPGLGIAGIFNIALPAIGAFIESIFKVGKAFNFAAADAEVFKKANAAVGDDMARLGALVSVAQDVTLSTQQRTNAIAELQKLYPDYLRNINLENINSAATKLAIDELTRSIISKAVAQAYSTKVAEETLKLDGLQEKVNKRLIQQGGDISQLQKLRADPKTPADALKKYTGIIDENNNKLQISNIEFNKQQDVVNKLTGRLKDVTAASLDFAKTPKIPPLKNLKDVKEGLSDLEYSFRKTFASLKAVSEEFAGTAFENFKNIIQIDQRVRIRIIADIVDGGGSAFDNFTKEIPKISSELQKEVDKLTKNNPILLAVDVKPKIDTSKVELSFKDIKLILERTATDAFAGIGEMLGDALSGGGIQKGFQAFANILASGVQAIGKQIIALGVAALLAKKSIEKFLFLRPELAIAAGIALVAVGAAMKQLLSGGVKGFAQGGKVQKGVPILVGEQGKEIFVPDSSGKIIPNHQITNISSHADSRTDSHLEKKEFVKVITKPVVESSLLNTFSSIIKNIFHRVYNTENKSESNQDNRFYESLVTKVDSLTKGDVFRNSVNTTFNKLVKVVSDSRINNNNQINNNEETVKNSVKSELSILKTFSSLVKNIFKSVQNHTENYNTENNDNRRFSSPFTKIEGDVIYNTRLNTFFSKFSEFIKNISSVYNVKKESSYAVGGFTGAGGRSEPAGIVHKGEYVIPAFAVQKLGISFLNQLAFGHNIRGFQSGGFVGNPVSSGGMNIQVSGYLTGRGNDLIAVISAATRSQGRLT